MSKPRSPFRFAPSRKRFEYSVHRGDQPIGYVTKIVHTLYGKTYTAGWRPSHRLMGRIVELVTEKNREAAARALWKKWQEIQRL